MIEKYTQEEFDAAGSRDYLPLLCLICGETFLQQKHFLQTIKKGNSKHTADFCSSKCSHIASSRKGTVILPCMNCGVIVVKLANQYKKCKNTFCSRSCAGFYNAKHKKTGVRRSKLEKLLEKHIKKDSYKVICNDRTVIGIELDFYFPDYSLAVELNGPLHYKPIYGEKKLLRIKQLDKERRKLCKAAGIKLLVFDVSQDRKAEEYLKDILPKILRSLA